MMILEVGWGRILHVILWSLTLILVGVEDFGVFLMVMKLVGKKLVKVECLPEAAEILSSSSSLYSSVSRKWWWWWWLPADFRWVSSSHFFTWHLPFSFLPFEVLKVEWVYFDSSSFSIREMTSWLVTFYLTDNQKPAGAFHRFFPFPFFFPWLHLCRWLDF